MLGIEVGDPVTTVKRKRHAGLRSKTVVDGVTVMTSNKVLPGERPNELNNNACDHPPCQPQVVTLPPPDGGPSTKATRKARNRRGRSDEIENKLFCFPDCKRGRAQSESMVQCHACQTWAQYDCIGEGEDDIVGIWTCNACRKIPRWSWN